MLSGFPLRTVAGGVGVGSSSPGIGHYRRRERNPGQRFAGGPLLSPLARSFKTRVWRSRTTVYRSEAPLGSAVNVCSREDVANGFRVQSRCKLLGVPTKPDSGSKDGTCWGLSSETAAGRRGLGGARDVRAGSEGRSGSSDRARFSGLMNGKESGDEAKKVPCGGPGTQ